jgi:hypothetical protein
MSDELTHSVFKYVCVELSNTQCRKIEFQRTNKQRRKVNPKKFSSDLLVPATMKSNSFCNVTPHSRRSATSTGETCFLRLSQTQRKQVPPKRWSLYLPNKQHGVTFQKTNAVNMHLWIPKRVTNFCTFQLPIINTRQAWRWHKLKNFWNGRNNSSFILHRLNVISVIIDSQCAK